jgi:hypothetical protein
MPMIDVFAPTGTFARMIGFLAAFCALTSVPAHAATARVEVVLDPARARTEAVPATFAGLSLEMQAVRAGFNTPPGHWLSASNTPFVTLVKTLGVRCFRIGGNTTERNSPDGNRPLKPYPSDADATHVNDFASAIGAEELIWNLPVAERFDPTTYSDYGARMLEDQAKKGYRFKTIFEIGNEPDLFKVSLEDYPRRFDAYSKALEDALGERALYCGPSAAGANTYLKWLVSAPRYQDPSLKGHIAYVTHHAYPFGGAASYTDASAGIAALLQPTGEKYAGLYKGWAARAREAGFRPRLGETNSIYSGGLPGASDSFAAALWALDYLSYFSNETELAGINFHNAGSAAYNAFSPAGLAADYTLKGVGYGLLAFAQNGPGRPVPPHVLNAGAVNLTVYALLHGDGTETVRLINKTHGSTAVDATVVVDAGKGFRRAEVMYLTVSGDDPAASTGITLGGKPMEGDGTWAGGFTVQIEPQKGRFSIPVPHTQAAIVRLSSR